MPGKRALSGGGRAYVGFWFHCSPNPSLTGITVADLEQLFCIHGDPDLYRLMKVLRVLGVSLSVVQGAEQT